MNLAHPIKTFIKNHWVMCVPAALFFLLLLRNPFSSRTLIPNLEPYPDSIHYLSPVRSLLKGSGFSIEREGRTMIPSVPPLYSLVMVPVFLIHNDVRMFYFVNVALAFGSFLLMYSIVKRLFPMKGIQFFVLTLYVSNYLNYWLPELAMAEGLLLFFFLAACLILLSKVSVKNAVWIGVISVAFYATKYASLPLSCIVPLLYVVKLLRAGNYRANTKIWMTWILTSLIVGVVYLLFESVARSNNIIGTLLHVFLAIVHPVAGTTSGSPDAGGGAREAFFSLQYVQENVRLYWGWLQGKQMLVLWKQIVILPSYLAMLGLAGIATSLLTKRRWMGVVLCTSLVAVLAMLAPFYVADGRYFLIAVPSLILGVGLALQNMYELNVRYTKKFSVVLLLLIFAVYAGTNVQRLKFDVMLNLKYTETPWYYLSVRSVDTFLAQKRSSFTKTPVVISALPPYVVDFYSTEKSILLPLHKMQEFRSHRTQAWGEYDYENLEGVYTQYLKDGNPVFLSEYGLGNEAYLHVAFDTLLKQFDATKVYAGCYDLCDIYELHLKSTLARPSQKKSL